MAERLQDQQRADFIARYPEALMRTLQQMPAMVSKFNIGVLAVGCIGIIWQDVVHVL